jgi:hypothetical protein
VNKPWEGALYWQDNLANFGINHWRPSRTVTTPSSLVHQPLETSHNMVHLQTWYPQHLHYWHQLPTGITLSNCYKKLKISSHITSCKHNQLLVRSYLTQTKVPPTIYCVPKFHHNLPISCCPCKNKWDLYVTRLQDVTREEANTKETFSKSHSITKWHNTQRRKCCVNMRKKKQIIIWPVLSVPTLGHFGFSHHSKQVI